MTTSSLKAHASAETIKSELELLTIPNSVLGFTSPENTIAVEKSEPKDVDLYENVVIKIEVDSEDSLLKIQMETSAENDGKGNSTPTTKSKVVTISNSINEGITLETTKAREQSETRETDPYANVVMKIEVGSEEITTSELGSIEEDVMQKLIKNEVEARKARRRHLAHERQKRWRAKQTQESRAKIRALDAASHQERLNQMTPEQLAAYRNAHNASQKRYVNRLAHQQLVDLHKKEAASHRKRKERMTPEQLTAYRVANAASQRRYIERVKSKQSAVNCAIQCVEVVMMSP